MHTRNKKILTIFAVGFLILSSVGVVAQDNNREQIEYNEELKSLESEHRTSFSDRRVNGMSIEDSHLVAGTSSYNVSTFQLNNFSNHNRTSLPFNVGDNGVGFVTVGDRDNPVNSYITSEYVWGKRAFESGENSGTYLSSNNGGSVIHTSNEPNVGTATKTTYNKNGEIVVFEEVDQNDVPDGSLWIYYPNNGTTEELVDNGFNTANAYNRILAFNPNPKELIITSLFTQTTFLIDRETGEMKKINQPVLEVAQGKLMLGVSEGFNSYDSDSFVDEAMEKDLENITANTKIESPTVTDCSDFGCWDRDLQGYKRIEYIGGRWFMDASWEGIGGLRATVVYNEDITEIETVFSSSFNGGGNYQKTYQYFVQDRSIKFVDNTETSSGTRITLYDTDLDTPLCGGKLNPHTLQNFWETPSPCWLPIFVGEGILVSIYQWLMLAIMISMPIASETDSDIATMATIDGVLLIGMLVGGISPGYVAIAILATILLSTYQSNHSKVNVDMGDTGL